MNLPLSTLILKLEHAGLKLSPAEQLNVQQVMHKLGSKYLEQPEQLERILGPVIAKDESEQLIFQQTFREYLSEIRETSEIEFQEEDDFTPTAHIQEKLHKKRKSLYLISSLALASLLILWSYVPFNFQPEYEETSQSASIPPHVLEGLKEQIANLEEGVTKTPPIYGEEVEEILAPSQEDFTFSIGHGPRHVNAKEKFNFQLDLNSNISDLKTIWNLGDGNTSEELSPEHTYTHPGMYTVTVSVQSAKHDIFEIKEFTFPVYPIGTTYASVAPAHISSQEDTQNRIKWQVFFFAFFMILGVEGYLEKYKQKQYKLAFQQYFHRGENAPYTLPYDDVHEQLQAESGMYSLAENLKKRRISELMGLDVKSSLYETVQAGGFPQLIYTPEKASTEYLVLIDESGPSDHQALLFEQFVSLLKKEEVLIQDFKFRNDPRLCYNDEYPEGIELNLISRRVQADRLLIFSKGSFFLDLKTHELADWTEEAFSPWQHKVLLTPEPVNSWGFRERALQKAFHVLAADLEAQQGIVEALLAEDFQDFEGLKAETLVSSYASVPLAEYDLEDKEDLESYLGDALYKWLMASMVSQKPSWAMTLKIGKALEAQSSIVLEGNKLVSYDNLLKLSRIPWLQSGEVPQGLKEDLLRQLDEETEEVARHAVLDLLKQTHVPKDSLAYQEKLIEQTVQEAALAPENKVLQKKLSFLWKNDMLNQSMRGIQVEGLGPKFMEFLSRHQRALAPAFIGTILLAFLTFSGIYAVKYSNAALVEKHFEAFPFRADVNESGDYLGSSTSQAPDKKLGRMMHVELFERGILMLKEKNYREALVDFEQVKIEGFGSEVHHWYMALAYLGNGEKRPALDLLSEIKKDPNNLYYFKAIELLNDLNSYWRF